MTLEVRVMGTGYNKKRYLHHTEDTLILYTPTLEISNETLKREVTFLCPPGASLPR